MDHNVCLALGSPPLKGEGPAWRGKGGQDSGSLRLSGWRGGSRGLADCYPVRTPELLLGLGPGVSVMSLPEQSEKRSQVGLWWGLPLPRTNAPSGEGMQMGLRVRSLAQGQGTSPAPLKRARQWKVSAWPFWSVIVRPWPSDAETLNLGGNVQAWSEGKRPSVRGVAREPAGADCSPGLNLWVLAPEGFPR